MIEEQDVSVSIYEVPQMLEQQGLDRILLDRLGLASTQIQLDDYLSLLDRIRNPRGQVEVALVGKYIQLTDAYKSVYEALTHGGFAAQVKVRVRRVQAEDVRADNVNDLLSGVHGVVVPGGFGARGIEGKIEAIRWARENRVPFFGLCLGMQCATIEIARHLAGLEDAHSTEFDPDTPHPVIDLMADQQGLEKGGTMRLGSYRCALALGLARARRLRRRDDPRAPPPPLRVQQRLPRAARGRGPRRRRHQSRARSRRDHRTARPPVVRGGPVPPRVQEPADDARTRCSGTSWPRPSSTRVRRSTTIPTTA